MLIRPMLSGMVNQPLANRGDFCLGAPLLGPSNSRESLPGGEKQPVKKTNPHALTKKLNTKIQAVASRLTDIIVWDSKIHESELLLGTILMVTSRFNT